MTHSITPSNNRIANDPTTQTHSRPVKKWALALLAIAANRPEIAAASRSVNVAASRSVSLAGARVLANQVHNSTDPLANLTAFLDGEYSVDLAPAEMISAAREYLVNNPLPAAAEDLTPMQAQLFAFMKNELVKSTDLIPVHLAWHGENGAGGEQGPGSGVKFMDFHHGMLNDVKQFLGGANQTIPVWTNFDSNITQIIPAPAGVSRRPSQGRFETPSYLSQQGGDDVFTLDGREFTSLEDFSNPDDLGRVIGESFHSVGHFQIGGTMTGFEAPRDPIFDTWHGALDKILTEWIETNSGQAYLNTDDGKQWHANLGLLTGMQFESSMLSDAPSDTPSSAPSGSPSSELNANENDGQADSSSPDRSKAAQLAAATALLGAGLNLL